MDLKINILVFALFVILAGSGVGAGSLAFMALDPDPYGIPVGHVAFGFQQEDGKYVVGSFGPDGLEGPLIFDDLRAVKSYLSTSLYTSIKAIHVQNPDPNAANEMMTTLAKDSGFVAIQSAYPNEASSIIMPGTENCLTFAIKVLEAYGEDMPAIIPLITTWPRAYYDALSKLGWIESSLSVSKLAQAGVGTPKLPSPTSEDYSNSNPPAHPGVIPVVNRPEGYPPGGNSGWVPCV